MLLALLPEHVTLVCMPVCSVCSCTSVVACFLCFFQQTLADLNVYFVLYRICWSRPPLLKWLQFAWTSTYMFGSVRQKRGKHAAGDVALAASILFTGCSIKQSLRFLENAGVSCFGERTYHHLQYKLLLPAVNKVVNCSIPQFYWSDLK